MPSQLLTPTTRLKTWKASSDRVAELLECNGFHSSVAGADFATAVDAVVRMCATGRGIFATGPAGCGKTQFMRAMQRILNNSRLTWFYCKEPSDMAELRTPDDLFASNVYIDDIGAEEIVKEYGNTVDVVGDFVQRYHYRGTRRFFATTNLNSAQINERYGGRVLDRILEMCVVLPFKGVSKRERVVAKQSTNE